MTSAAERIEALRARNPKAVELRDGGLARGRVDPELLRHARLELGADAAAEADLWWSDLVARRTPTGSCSTPHVAESCAPGSSAIPSARGGVGAGQRSARRRAPRDPSGRARQLAVDRRRDRTPRPRSRSSWSPARTRGWRRRRRRACAGSSARWGGFRQVAAESSAATAIRAAAATHAGREPQLDALPAGRVENWFPWLLAKLPLAPLRVALVDGGIEFEADAGEPFPAPDTDPVTLALAWHDGGPQRRQVSVRRGERTAVALNADEVELTTLAGRRFTVRRRRQPRRRARLLRGARGAPAGGRAGADGRGDPAARVGRWGWGEIGGPPGAGKTTALCAALDALEADGAVVLQHFFGRGPAWWDQRETVRRSLVAQLRAAIPDLPDPVTEGRQVAVRGSTTFIDTRARARGTARGRGRTAARRGRSWSRSTTRPPAAATSCGGHVRVEFSSLLPPGCGFIVASRAAGGVRDWLEDGDPYWRVEMSAVIREVTRAYIRVALGAAAARPRAGADRARRLRDDQPARRRDLAARIRDRQLGRRQRRCRRDPDGRRETIEFARRARARAAADRRRAARPAADALRSHGDRHAGRAARASAGADLGRRRAAGGPRRRLDRAAARDRRLDRHRPAGTADLSRLPASLLGTVPLGLRFAGEIAVARPGFTLADLLWAIPVDEWASSVSALNALWDLSCSPSRPVAGLREPRAELIERHGTTPLVSTDPGLASVPPPMKSRRLTAELARRPAQGRRRAVVLRAPRGRSCRRRRRHRACASTCARSAALTRRARQLGLHVVAADLDLAATVIDIAPVRDAVFALAARDDPVEDFPRSLVHELHARGVADARRTCTRRPRGAPGSTRGPRPAPTSTPC